MAGVSRNFWLAGALLAALAIAAAVLPSAQWICGAAALLGLAGVVLLRGNPWRSGALLVAAVAVSLVLLDAFAGFLTPSPIGLGVVWREEPRDWTPSDPLLGYRPRPDTKVLATATYGTETIYDKVLYTIAADGTRSTPPAPAGADTYLFLGDSFMFGQGLPDDQSLAAQFARLNDFKVRAVNFSAPGYGPNHLVRAFETGLLDRYADQHVKAVVTWIIPSDLARITGDSSWLGSSPRYVLEGGILRHTGSFNEHRWHNPLAGLTYLASDQFAFVRAIGMRQRQAAQADLFVALMVRLQALAKEKFGAPLVVVCSWPDETAGPGRNEGDIGQPLLVAVLARLRTLGIPLISVDRLTNGYDVSRLLFPHEGHPTAFTNQRIAGELKQRLLPQ
ncbi:MAG: hypothetical protein ACHQK9_17185 [Reyranellales bacterium]